MSKIETLVFKIDMGVSKIETGVSKIDTGISKIEMGVSKIDTGVFKIETGVDQHGDGHKTLKTSWVCAIFKHIWIISSIC